MQFSEIYDFVKKTHQRASSKNRQFKMDGDSKKSHKTGIIEFYKLNLSKGKAYTFKHFKNGGVDKTTIYRWLKKFEHV